MTDLAIAASRPLADAFHGAERMYAGAMGPGDSPRDLIIARLQACQSASDIEEFQANMKTDWELLVLASLLNRYGIKAYRYRKQRKSTVMLRLSKRFMDDILWPIFTEVSTALQLEFTRVTKSLLPEIAPGPYSIMIVDHEHSHGQICQHCHGVKSAE